MSRVPRKGAPLARRSMLHGAMALGAMAAGHKAGLAQPRDAAATDEFDYVVVGAGAGGGPVAARLALHGFRVVVLEAGGVHRGPNYDVPARHLFASEDPEMSWNFYVRHYSDPAMHGRRFVDARDGMLYPRAATVGGCTAHHAMVMLLAANRDWDRLAALTGEDGFRAGAMRRYFDRVKEWLPIEQASPLLLLQDPVLARLATATALETGAIERGAGAIPNFNDLSQTPLGFLDLDPNARENVDAGVEGLFMVPQSTKDMKRRGVREFLEDVAREHPDRLEIRTHALAAKIVLSEDATPRANGVHYLEGEHLYAADPMVDLEALPKSRVVRARREVVLAGGAFNSPQLLMLSGIGDCAALERTGMSCRVDLPGVGHNLQDRYETAVVSRFDQPFSIIKDCRITEADDPCLDRWTSCDRLAPYATNGIILGVKAKSGVSPVPDLFVFGSPARFEGYAPGFAENAVREPHYFTWAVLRGYSGNRTGSVELRSLDPRDVPSINFRYFDDGAGGEEDLAAVRHGMRLARAINERAHQLAWLDPNRAAEDYPGAELADDAELDDFIKKEAWGHHASCSNKMGVADDPMAVVDPQFRVRGVEGLRIVDASVFPEIPGLFIVLPLYMLAERAADVILDEAEA